MQQCTLCALFIFLNAVCFVVIAVCFTNNTENMKIFSGNKQDF
jgi:hypothetical protein